ncbi:MAG: MerR family DNA-binding transcriptional regulator [Patescibacteria group bacterium]
MNDKYLTIKKVAQILGVTPLTLRNWDKKGLLAAYRNPVNNYRLYRYADVADFIASIRRTGSQRGAIKRISVTPATEEEKIEQPDVEYGNTGVNPLV